MGCGCRDKSHIVSDIVKTYRIESDEQLTDICVELNIEKPSNKIDWIFVKKDGTVIFL